MSTAKRQLLLVCLFLHTASFPVTAQSLNGVLRSLARISWTFEARNCTIPSWLTVPMPDYVRSTLC